MAKLQTKCPYCSVGFVNRDPLFRHVINKHHKSLMKCYVQWKDDGACTDCSIEEECKKRKELREMAIAMGLGI